MTAFFGILLAFGVALQPPVGPSLPPPSHRLKQKKNKCLSIWNRAKPEFQLRASQILNEGELILIDVN